MKATATASVDESITVKQMSADWLEEQVRLLRDEARDLSTVVVSVRRVSWNYEWSVRREMEALLRPLEMLKGRLEFRVGEVMGPGSVGNMMEDELGVVLRNLNG